LSAQKLNVIVMPLFQEKVSSANGNRTKEAELIGEWAKSQFGMTAELNETDTNESVNR
jgi:hypothetical protein